MPDLTTPPRARDLGALLSRDAERTADLRPGIVVGVLGPRLHVVRLPGTEETVVVTSAAGRQSWAPGSEVALGSYSGASEYFIVGLPPPGHRGGSLFPSRTLPPGERPLSPYHVLHEDPAGGRTLAASLYAADGSWVSTRATRTLVAGETSVFAGGAQIIREDPGGVVSPNSFLLPAVSQDLRVWDVDGAADYRLAPEDGSGNRLALWPAWRDGWVYWAQFSAGAGSYSLRLRRARADLASPEDVGAPVSVAAASWPTFAVADAASEYADAVVTVLTAYFAGRSTSERYVARALLRFVRSPAAEVYQWGVVSFAWDGSGGSVELDRGQEQGAGEFGATGPAEPLGWWPCTNTCTGVPYPGVPDASLVAVDPTEPLGTSLASIDGDLIIADLWPPDLPPYLGFVEPTAAIISLDSGIGDGEVASLTRWHSRPGELDDVVSHHVYRGLPTSGAPTKVEVQNLPATGALPGSLFLREE